MYVWCSIHTYKCSLIVYCPSHSVAHVLHLLCTYLYTSKSTWYCTEMEAMWWIWLLPSLLSPLRCDCDGWLLLLVSLAMAWRGGLVVQHCTKQELTVGSILSTMLTTLFGVCFLSLLVPIASSSAICIVKLLQWIFCTSSLHLCSLTQHIPLLSCGTFILPSLVPALSPSPWLCGVGWMSEGSGAIWAQLCCLCCCTLFCLTRSWGS